jgi:hypothetical protein
VRRRSGEKSRAEESWIDERTRRRMEVMEFMFVFCVKDRG